MGTIYKEIIRHKRISFIRGLALLFLSILSINILVNSSSYSTRYNIELGLILLADSILLVIMLKFAFDLAYLHRICYTYKLIDRELIFERKIGNSRKVILSVDTKYMELLSLRHEVKNIKGIDRTYKFLCNPLKSRTYCCVVNHHGKRIMFYFQPSDELVNKIKTILSHKIQFQTN